MSIKYSLDAVVVVSYEPAPLLQLLGLDTERIIVPFSSKAWTTAYLAHVATVVWCVLMFVSYNIVITVRYNYQPQFQDQQPLHPFNSRRAGTDDIIVEN